MDDDTQQDESAFDRVKDAVEGVLGGKSVTGASGTVDDQIGMDDHMRQDIGQGVADVRGDPYGGSAGSDALTHADAEIPGTSPREPLSGATDDPVRP